MKLLMIVGLCDALSACVKSGVQTEFASAVPAAEMLDELALTAAVAESQMPDTGTATFEGYATLAISTVPTTDVDDILMIGVSTLEADFEPSASVSGSVMDIEALVPTPTGSEFQQVTGSIVIDDETSGIVGNVWAADYGGLLVWADDAVTLDGAMNGQFLTEVPADPANPVTGVVGGDLFGDGTLISSGFADVEIVVFGQVSP